MVKLLDLGTECNYQLQVYAGHAILFVSDVNATKNTVTVIDANKVCREINVGRVGVSSLESVTKLHCRGICHYSNCPWDTMFWVVKPRGLIGR